MKKSLEYLLCFLLFFFTIFSCSDNTTNPDIEAPTVDITNPTNNSEIISGTIVNIVAEAYDNVEIDKLKFYINDSLTIIDNSFPYEYSWDTSNYSSQYSIFCIAYDTSNNQTISDSIIVTVIIPNEKVFAETFENANNWILSTSYDPTMDDNAIAEVTQGILNLTA